MSFSITGGKEYDIIGNAANIGDGSTDSGPNGPFTGEDNDNDFEVGESVPGTGSPYMGYIVIGGLEYPVVNTSSGGIDTLIIAVPDYAPYPAFASVAFPGTIDILNDVIQLPFNYCFAAGTMIETSEGDVAVEDLTRKHLVRTSEGTFQPVKWVGRQTMLKRVSHGSKSMVRFSAGSLGAGIPHQDLDVTADHGMVVDGLVINASALINGSTIDFVPSDELDEVFTVYHVETEAHDVIFANGAASETFLDMAERKRFDNYQEYLDLYETDRIIPELDMPRITSVRLVPDSVKARLGIKTENRSSLLQVA